MEWVTVCLFQRRRITCILFESGTLVKKHYFANLMFHISRLYLYPVCGLGSKKENFANKTPVFSAFYIGF